MTTAELEMGRIPNAAQPLRAKRTPMHAQRADLPAASTQGAPIDEERPAHLERRERWALALIGAGTLAIMPFALNRFVFPKLAVVAFGLALAATVPARGRLPRTVVTLLGAAVSLLVLAALEGSAPAAQLLGRAPRYEGILALAVYIGCGAAGARLFGPARARGATVTFLRIVALAAAAVGALALAEAVGLRPLATDVARPGSLLGNASEQGAWAVLALGPLTAAALRVRGHLYAAGALGAFLALVLSGSRGALLGMLATGAVLFILAPRRELRVVLVTVFALALVAALAVPSTRDRVIGAAPSAGHTTVGRSLLWQETTHLAGAHVLTGVGPSGFKDAIPAYHDDAYEDKVGPANPPDSPHNWLLQAWSSGGAGLAALALALALLTLRRGSRACRRQVTLGEAAVVGGMLAGLVGYGVALLFHFTAPGTTPLAAFMAGALLAAPLSPRVNKPRLSVVGLAHIRHGVAALFAVVAFISLAASVAEIPLRRAIEAAASNRLARADADFRLARLLRPWDGEVDATAGHAYATLVRHGIPDAAQYARLWTERQRGAQPGSAQAFADAAVASAATGDIRGATRFATKALELDPANPQLEAQMTDFAAGPVERDGRR